MSSTLPAVLVPADVGAAALAAWQPGSAAVGESVRVWSRIAAALDDANALDALAEALPTAGHAAIGLDGATIWSADAAVSAARRAVGCDRQPEGSRVVREVEVVCARRLQLGDPGGHVRRALGAFPLPGIAERIVSMYYVPGGKPADAPFRPVPRFTLKPAPVLQELTIAANFVELLAVP